VTLTSEVLAGWYCRKGVCVLAKVLGFGGVFFKVSDPKAYCDWYANVLGVDITDWGTMEWESDGQGRTMFSPFSKDTTYLEPSQASFMVNLRVDDVATLIERVRSSGADFIGNVEDTEFGIFGWFIDPEGIKIELWQEPPTAESA